MGNKCEKVDMMVVSSKVKSHDSDDGTTYSPYIAYRYEVSGEEFFGDQLSFMGGSSSGYAGKAEIVRIVQENCNALKFEQHGFE